MPASIATSPETFRPMMRLALPVLAENLLFSLVGLVDTYLAARYLVEDQYLAAMGLMAYAMWLLSCLFGAIAIGATAIVSRRIGEGSPESASRTANQAILTGAVAALPCMLLVWLLGPAFVQAMQLQGAAAESAEIYLSIISFAVPAMMLDQVGFACLRGAGNTISGFATMLVVNVVNGGVSYLLVTGEGPLPQLGWEGLAIGTLCGHLVGGAIVLALLLRGTSGLKLDRHVLRPNPPLVRQLLKVGIPGGADMLSMVLCHLWFLAIINSLGVVQAAAHGLAIRIESLSYLPGAAFQVAAATLAGQFLGAKVPRQATRAVLMCLLVGGGLMLVAGAIFFTCAEPLTGLFLGDENPQTAVIAAPLLQVVALAQPCLATAMILTGALRGAGDTRWPLMINLFCLLTVRIPGAYFLACGEFTVPILGMEAHGLGLGVIGAWYAMFGDIVLRAALILWRFSHGGWQRAVV